MAHVKKGKYGKYVEGKIILTLSAELKDGDDRDQIPDEEALKMLRREQDYLAGSNDGSEAIANARVQLHLD